MTNLIKGTGGQILAACLKAQGIQRLSCVAGESYLPVLDALLDHPDIQVVTCRHESGAGFMAEAWGKLNNRMPGVVFVTRGPGACNASIAVHTARQDSTPLILFMGQVRREERGREAFQEISVEAVFGSMAKWAADIDDPARIPEFVNRAFHLATSGRPGPVVLGLPEDMLSQMSEAVIPAPFEAISAAPKAEGLKQIHVLLSGAKRPLVIIGGAGWDDESISDIESFCARAHLPVAVSFRRHDVFNHTLANYIGELGTGPNPKLTERIKQADVILCIGARLNEITTQGYTLLGEPPQPAARLIHVHPEPAELGKVYRPDIGVACGMKPFVAALAGDFSVDGRGWAEWTQSARAEYEAWTDIPERAGKWSGADMTAIYARLRELLPADSIITSDAGNFSGWAQRYIRYRRPGRFLGPISGAMGYAVPSALAASIAHPDKVVLGLCGDGGFMMTGNELATAMHHGAKPVIMVCNNGMYGTIRMHQEKKYPGRVSATDLTNPDFVAYAQSFGVFAARVEKAEDFESVWNAAISAGRAALIEIRMDPRQITTQAKV